MHAPRPAHFLLSLFAALALVLAPLSAHAGGARPASRAGGKPLPPRTQKVAKKALSGASAEQKAKAMTSLSHAMASRQDLRMSTTKQASYLKHSVSAQKGAAKRATKPAAAKARKAVKTARAKKATRVKRTRMATASKKSRKQQLKKKARKKALAAAEEEAAAPVEEFEEGYDEIATDDDDWGDILDNLDPGVMAQVNEHFAGGDDLHAQGFEADAADQYILGHEMAADEAYAAAEDYKAEERFDEAAEFEHYGDMQQAEANRLREEYPPDETDAPAEHEQARDRGGFIQRLKSNHAAKKAFNAMMEQDPGMRGEYNRLKREKTGFKSAFFAGIASITVVRNLLPIIAGVATVANVAFLGLGAFTVGSVAYRQYKVRDASRKELVKDLHASGELTPQEIDTYSAAGWL